MITYISGKSTVECPFCHKTCVTAFYKPSFAQGSKSSSASAGSKTTYSRVAEKHFIQGDCPNCGAKEKDIQKWYDGQGQTMTEEERKKVIKRLKDQGIPTQIEF